MLKLAIIFHRFGPYHKARVEATAGDFDVTGVELSKDSKEYAWDAVSLREGCRRVVVCEEKDSRDLPRGELRSRLERTLDSIAPDAVAINGWADSGALAALHYCAAKNIPAVVMSETNRMDFARNPAKEMVKSFLVKSFRAALVGGSLARDYVCELGMPPENVFAGYDAIDNAKFALPEGRSRDSFRVELGLARPYFLASNRFIPKKNLARLIEAYAKYRQAAAAQGGNELWDLVLLGDGAQRQELLDLVQRLEIGGYVHFPGFRQYDDLPHYYWGAGAFVHASTTEQWGLVVNEAMAAGLPVIVSNRCGCAADLVVHGENGFSFDPTNVPALAGHMTDIAGDAELRSQMSAKSRQRIADWGPERFASGMKQAVERALARGGKPSLLRRTGLNLLCRFG